MVIKIDKNNFESFKNNKVNKTFIEECREYSKLCKLFNYKKYDYKKNLQHLKGCYENKIETLQNAYNITDSEDYFYNEGLIEGLKTAIHDIEYILNEMEA